MLFNPMLTHAKPAVWSACKTVVFDSLRSLRFPSPLTSVTEAAEWVGGPYKCLKNADEPIAPSMPALKYMEGAWESPLMAPV